ncbi:lactoylglutathione lyase [Limtongia smithiae]|uniref:lactoylglutathione lyase n=1 Tax=Limtongia smithiae TaxID=1125753 RepID=UPI0034CE28EA
MSDLIDHISISVTDFVKAQIFYGPVLELLGFGNPCDFDGILGYQSAKTTTMILLFLVNSAPSTPLHVAFRAQSKAQVQKFYDVAMAHGGTDNGAPGLRPDYGDNYYGAFVLDPDGNNVEFVARL